MLFGPPSPRNADRHGTGGRGAYARPVRGELAVRPSALPAADAIGSLSREEKEPTGTIVRPVLCRGGGYEEVPPPEPLPPPDVPPMGGHAGGGV